MPSFNFKSSGVQLQQTISTIPLFTGSIPVGIKTPVKLGTADHEDFLGMNFLLSDQITDNLRNLVQTNWGERLGHYSYGANLRPLLTELVSSNLSQEDFETGAINRIRKAISSWMPYVTPQTLVTNINFDQNTGKGVSNINLNITYDIPTLGVTNKKLLVAFRIIG